MKKLHFFLAIAVFGAWAINTPLLYATSISSHDKAMILNDSPLHDENSSICTTNTGQVSAGADAGGGEVLNESKRALITKYQAVYEEAAREADIPWQMIAAIHIKETGLSNSNPDNGQGIYQFSKGEGGPYPTGPVSDEDFLKQTKFAAQFIKNKASSNFPENQSLSASTTSAEVIKDTFFSYNGRASVYAEQAKKLGYADNQAYEGSPYVMNKADSARDPSTSAPNTWGQIKTDGGPIQYPANNDFGAYVIFAALSGIQSGCSLFPGGGSIMWPEPGAKAITDCFGTVSPIRNNVPHEGLDISGGSGTPIIASSDGTVVFSGSAGGYGPNYVVIQHNGFATGYGHMSSKSVNVGDIIRQGDQIGSEGNEGNSTGSHLHFNIIPGDYNTSRGANVDPLKYGLSVPGGTLDTHKCQEKAVQ